MPKLRKIGLRLASDRRGITALEYGLIVGALAATMMVGFSSLSTQFSSRMEGIGTCLQSPRTCLP